MIVSANESGVLELFWRHRATTTLFRLTPADLRSLRTRQADIQYMRGWLELQPGCEGVRRLDDPKVIKRITAAVRSREIAVAEAPAGPRLPGTGVAISSAYGPMLLLPYRKLSHPLHLSNALGWLADLPADGLNNVRAVLNDNYNSISRSFDDDADIRQQVQALLESGDLIPVFTYYSTSAHSKVQESPAVQPPDLKRSSEPQDISEAHTFGPDHHVAEQAAAMTSAAASGVPFCEVCSRAR